jgi:hypothetical protein
MNKLTRPVIAALALAAATTATWPAVPAFAKGGGGDRVVHTGSCSVSAVWKLKVKSDDGRLEVEGQVDSNRSGQTWRWRIKHNGAVTARGVAQTAGPSGSFSVERRLVNLSGTDRVVFRAARTKTGEVCRGVVSF